MTCDRCGKKNHHIYITEDHEKVCKRTCNGEVNAGTRIFYASPKKNTQSSKGVDLGSSISQKISC